MEFNYLFVKQILIEVSIKLMYHKITFFLGVYKRHFKLYEGRTKGGTFIIEID